jgi:prepilin-type N-terminal cleavage/methylation domain-containing protein
MLRGSSGFSLLELMVALGLFAASFAVLIGAQMSATRSQAHTRNVFTATMLARELLAETEINGFSDFEEEEGEFGEEFENFTWRRTVGEVFVDPALLGYAAAMGANTQSIQVALPDLRLVTLQILWPEAGQSRSIETVYYTLGPKP